MNAILTFKASLSIARKPKYFLGIKIHRAIMQIDWELTADYSDTQVVDVLQLDQSKSETENARIVNQRISEIVQEYPSCEISTEYIKSEPMEEDNTPDTYHLLWSSDRLEIARQIDVLAPYINDEQGRRQTLLEQAFGRCRKPLLPT